MFGFSFNPFIGDKNKRMKVLRKNLQSCRDHNDLSQMQWQLFDRIMTFNDLTVGDIMIPRANIIAIDINDDLPSIRHLVRETKHSRYPVFQQSLDHVLGVFLTKDLLIWDDIDEQSPPLLNHEFRQLQRVPEATTIDKLLNTFKRTHSHMALVIDEFSNISGLVTIEDLLEQIVGDIEDEYDNDTTDQDHIYINPNGPGYFCDCAISVEKFNAFFKTHYSTEQFHTMSGILSELFTKIPHVGEKIQDKHLTFTVIKATSKHLSVVCVEVDKK